MNADDEILQAAAAQDLSLTKTDRGTWSVGLSASLEPLGVRAKTVDTFLSGGRIRLADGREFKQEMTTEEARIALGLDSEAGGS